MYTSTKSAKRFEKGTKQLKIGGSYQLKFQLKIIFALRGNEILCSKNYGWSENQPEVKDLFKHFEHFSTASESTDISTNLKVKLFGFCTMLLVTLQERKQLQVVVAFFLPNKLLQNPFKTLTRLFPFLFSLEMLKTNLSPSGRLGYPDQFRNLRQLDPVPVRFLAKLVVVEPWSSTLHINRRTVKTDI